MKNKLSFLLLVGTVLTFSFADAATYCNGVATVGPHGDLVIDQYPNGVATVGADHGYAPQYANGVALVGVHDGYYKVQYPNGVPLEGSHTGIFSAGPQYPNGVPLRAVHNGIWKFQYPSGTPLPEDMTRASVRTVIDNMVVSVVIDTTKEDPIVELRVKHDEEAYSFSYYVDVFNQRINSDDGIYVECR